MNQQLTQDFEKVNKQNNELQDCVDKMIVFRQKMEKSIDSLRDFFVVPRGSLYPAVSW